MTSLADRIVDQLRRIGPVEVVSVGRRFDVDDDAAGDAVDELLADGRGYRHGKLIFATPGLPEARTAPVPAAPPRQANTPPPAPPLVATIISRPVMNPPAAAAEAGNRDLRDEIQRVQPQSRERGEARPTAPEARPVSATAHPTKSKETPMAKKTCTRCAKELPLDRFYDSQSRCKDCMRIAAKERRDALKAGGSAPAAKSAGGGRRSADAAAASTAVKGAGEGIAFLPTETGFRFGPLHRSTAGLVSMPYWVDVTFEQLDEVQAMRQAAEG